MTPEEKNAILQFMGVTYGHSHKLDKDIVGESQFVKPISTAVRRQFEEVLKSPVRDTEQQFNTNIAPDISMDYMMTPVTPEVLNQQEDIKAEASLQRAEINIPNTDNTLFDVLNKINLNLKRIGDIIENNTLTSNVKPTKKTKNKFTE
jgi:hypothetical protein